MRCTACSREIPDDSRYCGGCGARLDREPESIGEATPLWGEAEGERRHLTVMFCDLVDSTTLSERLDPEDLRRVITAYQDACTKVVERYQGHIAQYLGDGILVYFAYPQAHEDDPERAVRAGLEILAGFSPAISTHCADHPMLLPTANTTVNMLSGMPSARKHMPL